MGSFPNGYVKQTQLSVKSDNHNQLSKFLCVPFIPPPSSKQKIGVEKKKVWEKCLQSGCLLAGHCVRVFALFRVNDELVLRGWPTSSVLPCELKPLRRVKWTRDNSFQAHFSQAKLLLSILATFNGSPEAARAGRSPDYWGDGRCQARLPASPHSEPINSRPFGVCVLSPFLHNQHFPGLSLSVYKRR